jgi:hypothetical protein
MVEICKFYGSIPRQKSGLHESMLNYIDSNNIVKLIA